MSGTAELEAAAFESLQARERLRATAGELQTRLDPKVIVDGAVEAARSGAVELAETAGNVAERNRGVVVAAGAVLLLVAAHRPVFTALRWAFRRRPAPIDERRNEFADERLYIKQKPSRRRQHGKDDQ